MPQPNQLTCTTIHGFAQKLIKPYPAEADMDPGADLDPQVDLVELPLGACLNRAYDEARFGEEIDYDQPPVSPLAEPDATWARELLAARRK